MKYLPNSVNNNFIVFASSNLDSRCRNLGTHISVYEKRQICVLCRSKNKKDGIHIKFSSTIQN